MGDGRDAFDISLDALSQLLLSDEPISDALRRVAELAVATIAACDMADVTVVHETDSPMRARTDPDGPSLDLVQLENGEGPVLDAVHTCEPVRVDSLADAALWPQFAAAAADAGVESCLVVPLVVRGECIGALNLYSRARKGFDADGERVGVMFAAQAAVVIANAQLHQACVDLTSQLEEALVSRAVIEQAKGVLMAQRHCGAEDAFEWLRLRSQQENRKVRDLAHDLVERVVSGPVE